MLQTKPLQDLLSQALSSNIHTAVLATPQGTLIAHAVNSTGNSSSQNESRRQARSLGAIANAIWKNYASIRNIDELWGEPNGSSDGGTKDGLMWMVIECEEGRLVLYRVPPLSENGLLLALAGTKDAAAGMMRAKAELITRYLEKPLTEIESI